MSYLQNLVLNGADPYWVWACGSAVLYGVLVVVMFGVALVSDHWPRRAK